MGSRIVRHAAIAGLAKLVDSDTPGVCMPRIGFASSPLLGSPQSFNESENSRMSMSARSNPRNRRNSTFTMKSGLCKEEMANKVSSPQPKICRPTLTPSGLVPIHHAVSSGVFGFDRLSSVGEDFADPRFSAESEAEATTGAVSSASTVPMSEYQILITVPHQLHIFNLRVDSPVLMPLNMSDIADFDSLKVRARELLLSSNHIDATDADLPLAFNVLGTRSFLPDENFDIKYLPAFIACAFDSDLGDERTLQVLDPSQ